MDERINIAYIGNKHWEKMKITFFDPIIKLMHYSNPVTAKDEIYHHHVDIVLCENDTEWIKGIQFFILQQEKLSVNNILFFLVSDEFSSQTLDEALEAGIPDCFPSNINLQLFFDKYVFLRTLKRNKQDKFIFNSYSPRTSKRVFEASIASLLLTFTMPIFIPFAIVLNLKAKENILNKSIRLGNGLKTFKFYKLSPASKKTRSSMLWKIARKAYLDKLPQLINVIKGDLSISGEKPLFPKESEMLSSEQWKKRVNNPAGITGKWLRKSNGSPPASGQNQLNNKPFGIIKHAMKNIPQLIKSFI